MATYLIQISRPLKFAKSLELRNSRLPVFYILDGNANFLTAAEICWRGETTVNWAGGGIVVAIGYPQDPTETGHLYNFEGRNRDYTPCAADGMPGEGIGNFGGTLGGADSFLDFVESELRPLVKSVLKGEGVEVAQEAFWGHSFGGLCVLHGLFTGKAGKFDTYYAVSPSIWWGEKFLVKEEEAFSGVNTRLELSFGLLEEELERTSRESQEDFEKRVVYAKEKAMGPNARAMYKTFKENGKVGNVRLTVFDGEDHGTVSTVGLLRALVQFFAD
ncbi:hypothetical protein SLS60_000099 [Paraconiothyrium brasiliense]|uniref:Uncharacterized protein n=1 Tax=Paraconiothyrium brasiliense TaxID=300254 RepID=A0ABR3S6Q6_9PLEO